MTDPQTFAMLVGGVGATAATLGKWMEPAAQEFFKQVLGPITAEAAALSTDFMAARRARRLEQVALRAAAHLSDAARTPVTVPDRTLIPLLEGASREDDAGLSEIWASLLANAADPSGAGVPPVYPAILGQLMPGDALLLAAIATLERDPPDRAEVSAEDDDRWGPSRDELRAVLQGATAESLEVAVDSVVALGIVEREGSSRQHRNGFIIFGQGELRLSHLGRRFLAACQPPR